MHEIVEQWVVRAEEDFGVAQDLVSRKSPFLNTVGFHCQQAAEKFLKALLVRCQIEFPKTHDIGELLDLATNVEPAVAASLRPAEALTKYGVEVRYPGDYPEMTPQTAEAAMNLASRVRDAVRASLRPYLDRGPAA